MLPYEYTQFFIFYISSKIQKNVTTIPPKYNGMYKKSKETKDVCLESKELFGTMFRTTSPI